ncbi:Vin3-like protein [Thalictrum thalictroides]|uniref:Vin3-like protein n=1 Tax=Thalictrum thalictroides TaxID=46969 RepID=A0A7J6V4A6_THATH|nr:Vin3-like protein [Thalictrum thalictroides]
MQEKRELVHEIARWSNNASEILLAWPRQDLADLISAELGMERKYSGVKKSWLIERLLKLLSEGSENSNDDLIAISSSKTQIGSKRPRKKDYSVLLATDHSDNFSLESHENKKVDLLFCQNVACKATLAQQSKFCKRCSCCICFQYDDNKDPSLWLICGSDSLKQEDSCGMSCHLQCALKNGRSGNMKNGFYTMLDGSFCCVSCGEVNGIMGSLRKQLLVAKDARRVDVLCQRISLSHTILKRTEEYKELQIILDTIVKKLNAEVGPVEQVTSVMARGLVSRLSCGAEVQQLCASALDSLHSFLPNLCPDQTDNGGRLSCSIQFEQVSSGSVVIVLEYGDMLLLDFLGCRIWHRKSTAVDYPGKPTHIVVRPEKRFVISDLDPSTEYSFKVSVFSSSKELGQWESTCVTQAPSGSSFSGLDAEYGKDYPISSHANSQKDSTTSSDDKLACSDNHSKVRLLDDISKNEECLLPRRSTSSNGEPFTGSMFVPATPCKSDGTQEVPSSTAKKHSAESNYEYCVRVIRWLECEGYMEKEFRVKFLTWFSLKSSMRDKRVVSAFVDALIDDPPSLADQLVDTFGDEISNEKKHTPRFAFCTKLWH